jgi:hypothetical protein
MTSIKPLPSYYRRRRERRAALAGNILIAFTVACGAITVGAMLIIWATSL